MAGVGLAVLGAVTTAFAGPRIGLPLLACGAAMGAFPFVVESPHFDLIVTVTLGCGAALLIWLAWDFIRDRVNAKPPQE
jgi:threonine/homoserine/homoserine lactone efflux protein